MKLSWVFLLLSAAITTSAKDKPTVYFIRHGEKPSCKNDPMLSPRGEKRSQCIRSVFGKDSGFDIGYIMAETPKSSQSLLFDDADAHHPPPFIRGGGGGGGGGGRESQLQLTSAACRRPRRVDGRRQRPYKTVAPLAKDLGLEVDISCGKKDIDCVKDAVEKYNGTGNILICWEHKRIKKIAKALGARHVEKWPKHVFDEIWIDPWPYGHIQDIVSEECPGLDD